MGDGIGAFVTTHDPELSAPTSEESKKIIGANQDAAIDSKSDYLLWSFSVKEIAPKFGIVVNQEADVIQRVKQRLRDKIQIVLASV